MNGQCRKSFHDSEWIKDTSQFNEDFIKNYIKESDEGSFFEVDVQYPENLHNDSITMIYRFYLRR